MFLVHHHFGHNVFCCRGYCSRRIRRLRKVLHVTQGDKRHFKRKDVTEAML